MCVALNPLFNKLMESEANEKTHSLVFLKEARLVRITFNNDLTDYRLATDAEINSIKSILTSRVDSEIIHTFQRGEKYPHPFSRDLTTWVDGEMYLLDINPYTPHNERIRYSYGGISIGGSSSFLKERFLELHEGDKIYHRSIYFKLSQFANWPVFPLALMAAF